MNIRDRGRRAHKCSGCVWEMVSTPCKEVRFEREQTQHGNEVKVKDFILRREVGWYIWFSGDRNT